MEYAMVPTLKTCIFDLDDTLYPLSSGLAPIVRSNITDYMVEKLGFDRETVNEKNIELFTAYGTTMAGLRATGYKFDFDEYHAFVHGRLPYHILKPDPLLKSILHSMPQQKFVFTNGDRNHAYYCLKQLGLEDCFQRVISFENLNKHKAFRPPPFHPEHHTIDLSDQVAIDQSWQSPVGSHVCCKPQQEAFLRALDMAGADPSTTIFFDDSHKNIAAAKAAGLHTVLVGASKNTPEADWALVNLHNLKDAIPEIWGQSEDSPLIDGPVKVEAVKA